MGCFASETFCKGESVSYHHGTILFRESDQKSIAGIVREGFKSVSSKYILDFWNRDFFKIKMLQRPHAYHVSFSIKKKFHPNL